MFKKFTKEFGQARDMIAKANRVLIISHIRPDADAIGANCALADALRAQGKQITQVCKDPLPKYCLFIPGAENFIQDFKIANFDLIISVDCGGRERTGFHEMPGFFDTKPFLNIDHHGTNDGFGNVNIVAPDACSTSNIIFEFLKFCEWPVSKAAANALLAGIYFDTGSLMHPNTKPATLRSVAGLIRLGANLDLVVKNLFKTVSVPQMHLWGKILERTRINDQGVVTSAAMEKDYEESGTLPEDASGVVDFLNSVSGGKMCVLLSDDQKGEVKGSVRTKSNDCDVSDIASMFGGGGHKKAAGFGIPGKITEERIFKIV